jgi:single-stranded-DNA-specific exonuclease
VGAFNMVEALRTQSELLTKFGGHFFAAGYTLPTEKLGKFRAGLNEHYLGSEAVDFVEPAKRADLQWEGLAAAEMAILDDLELLEPCGNGNRKPMFAIRNVAIDSLSKMGKDGKHWRMRLRDATGKRLAAVGFGLFVRYPQLQNGQKVTVLGELNKNEFQGLSSLQFIISELRNE